MTKIDKRNSCTCSLFALLNLDPRFWKLQTLADFFLKTLPVLLVDVSVFKQMYFPHLNQVNWWVYFLQIQYVWCNPNLASQWPWINSPMFNSKWERDSKTFFVGKAGIHDFLLASEASLLTRLPFGQKSNAAKCHDRLTFSLQAFKFHLKTFLFCQTRSGEVSSRGAFNGLCCKVYHSSRGKALKTLSCVLLLLKCWEWTTCEKKKNCTRPMFGPASAV